MAATNFEIIVYLYKGDALVKQFTPASLGASPDVGDAMGDIFSSVMNGILDLILAAVNINTWGVLAAALLSSVSTVAGGIVWTLVAVDQYITTIKGASQAIYDAVTDVTNGSNWLVNTSVDLALEESDEFDLINIRFHAYGEDGFPVWRTIFFPQQVVLDTPVYQTIGKNNHIIDCWVKPADLLQGGVYPFIFGARDDGFYFDVAGVCQLNLKWTKKILPLCSSLKSLNEHIYPVNPLRSLREVVDILGVHSLRAAFDELARCRQVYALPVRLYWQNSALMPTDLISVSLGDILGTKSLDFFEVYSKNLYKGRNRAAALEAFISYLRIEQPDIAGFGEFWLPADRAEVYASLRDIYPYDESVPKMFCLQGPTGDAPGGVNMMDGGMLLLSRFPILASDQYIYQSAYAEDAFSAKGILYAAIGVPGLPTPVHVFLTHLQNCPSELGLPESIINKVANIGLGGDCRSKQHIYQVIELYNFIQSKAGNTKPCIVMGDFNINSLNDDDSLAAEFKALMSRLGGGGAAGEPVGKAVGGVTLGAVGPLDSWVNGLRDDNSGADFYWPGLDQAKTKPDKRGKTCGGVKCFEPEQAELAWDACTCEGQNMDCATCAKDGSEKGFKYIRLAGGSLVDHIFCMPGPTVQNGTHIHFGRRRVVHIMLNETVDATDHAGLRVDIQSVRVRAG